MLLSQYVCFTAYTTRCINSLSLTQFPFFPTRQSYQQLPLPHFSTRHHHPFHHPHRQHQQQLWSPPQLQHHQQLHLIANEHHPHFAASRSFLIRWKATASAPAMVIHNQPSSGTINNTNHHLVQQTGPMILFFATKSVIPSCILGTLLA